MKYHAFDNTQSYAPGEIATYWGNYWQATRQVDPPIIPWLQSGDVPGESDAWKSAPAGSVILGDAGIDMNALIKFLKSMDPMTKAQAIGALTVGENAVKEAISVGTQSHLVVGPLLGPGAVNRVASIGSALSGVRNNLSATSLADTDVIAADIANSIRSGVERAIVEYNGVMEGDATLQNARSQFYQDAYDNLKALPTAVGKAVGSAISSVVGNPFHNPWVIGIGVGLAALLGYGLYRRVSGR
jgi:hypothetical protein